MRIRLAMVLALGLSTAVQGRAATAATCSTPIVFFDLGETLVHAEYVKAVDVFVNNKYMPGGHDYLRQLKRARYTLAMLVNYPESFGGGLPTIEERDARKIGIIKQEISQPLTPEISARPELKQFCQEHFGDRADKLCQTWTDDKHETFDWSVFGLPEFADIPGVEAGGILVPDKDSQRKPTPYLFNRALAIARALHQKSGRTARPCPVVFMGENPAEIKAANEVGMIGILVGQGSWVYKDGAPSFYYPLPLLKRLAKNPEVVRPNGPKL